MKILKKGNWTKPEAWSHILICTYCSSELEIDVSDVKRTAERGHQLDPVPERFTVVCGHCENTLDIPKGSMLPQVLKQLGSHE